MANRVQLYYGPMPHDRRQSLSVAVASGPADPLIPETYLTFSSRAGASGLIAPTTPSRLIASVATGQGVPVARDDDRFVRLFFEAQGNDGRTRVQWIDSRDGMAGLDFNAGAARTCDTAADYADGGGCAPTVAIAVEGDIDGNPRIAMPASSRSRGPRRRRHIGTWRPARSWSSRPIASRAARRRHTTRRMRFGMA